MGFKTQPSPSHSIIRKNITNLIGKFLDGDGNVTDAKGYHKAIYAAENVDRIAAHFYEQGKADAVKDVVNKSKNLVDTEGRKSQGDVFVGGFKVKAISIGLSNIGVPLSKTTLKSFGALCMALLIIL